MDGVNTFPTSFWFPGEAGGLWMSGPQAGWTGRGHVRGRAHVGVGLRRGHGLETFDLEKRRPALLPASPDAGPVGPETDAVADGPGRPGPVGAAHFPRSGGHL